MADPYTKFETARLAANMMLLRYYVIPKTRLRALILRLLGKRQPALQHLIANASIRWLSSTLSVYQFRAVTFSQCDANALLQNCPTLLQERVTTDTIAGEDYRGQYVAKFPNSKYIIFYVYGGGFVSGSPGSVMPYLMQLSVELQALGFQADMFVAEYDLAPENPYPVALKQVVSAYRHIAGLNKPIILAGDSAGGNLCLALLRHLVKPHPSIPPVHHSLEEYGHIIAACLNSPWVNLRNNGDSYRRSANQDCLDKKTLDRWRKAYLDGKPLDEYANPIDCIDGWKEILPLNTLLVSGDLDLFVADIRKLSRNIIQSDYKNLEVHIAPKKGHVWNLVDFGGTQPGLPMVQGSKDEAHIYAGICLQADWIVNRCEGRVM